MASITLGDLVSDDEHNDSGDAVLVEIDRRKRIKTSQTPALNFKSQARGYKLPVSNPPELTNALNRTLTKKPTNLVAASTLHTRSLPENSPILKNTNSQRSSFRNSQYRSLDTISKTTYHVDKPP